MTTEFNWERMYKTEEHVEREAFTAAFDYVCEFYEVEEIDELTEDQIKAITTFREEHVNEYSPMYGAFFDIINNWEGENDYTDEEDE